MARREERVVIGSRVSTAIRGETLVNTYQLEWNFVSSIKGGAWGEGWTLHTDYGVIPFKAAREKMREMRNGFTPEVRHHFRLVRTSRRVVAGPFD